MGNSCGCLSSSCNEGVVILMKQNGELIKYKKGVYVKEITTVHSGYKVVRCGSDRSVLSNSNVLQSNRLYFLIPEGLVLSDEIHDMFWQVAEARGLIRVPKHEDTEKTSLIRDSNITNGQPVVLLQGLQMNKSPWRPSLQTIPEIISPQTNKFL